jgi:hypothetical protein
VGGSAGALAATGSRRVARGRPEIVGVSVETEAAVDVIESLWTRMALFDDAAQPDTTTVDPARPTKPHYRA